MFYLLCAFDMNQPATRLTEEQQKKTVRFFALVLVFLSRFSILFHYTFWSFDLYVAIIITIIVSMFDLDVYVCACSVLGSSTRWMSSVASTQLHDIFYGTLERASLCIVIFCAFFLSFILRFSTHTVRYLKQRQRSIYVVFRSVVFYLRLYCCW